ncbi:MAG: DUF2029 domain-containing protein [Bacteroidetes bacterium]|nr:DUF2029 domain-containing protein [Bacteroidota bacterium]
MNLFFQNQKVQFVFLALVVFLSRLPFLPAGFGAEEDSWLLPLTAKNIALGHYEMSRAPGHPLHEIIYSWMWNAVPFWYNFLSAIASVAAVIFFALALRQLNFKHYLFASFAFAFTPIVFISSTYTIDYMLAMVFIMGSFYFIVKNNFWLAGIFLGIAIGFRLTSAAMLIPFCFLIGKNFKKIFVLTTVTLIVGLIAFLPVIKTYGLSFFTFSDQFPYPNLPKVFYKATIGVFGTIGILALIFYKSKILLKIFSRKEKIIPESLSKLLFFSCCAVIIIYIIAYLLLPQKSAYLIPIIPFIILLFGYYLSSREFKIFCILLTMSSFLFSMNLTDSLRGAEYSSAAMKFQIAGQEIFLDPLTGPVFSDYSKRLNKISFTEEVLQKTKTEQNKIVLICGWWYNELRVRSRNCEENQNVKLVFYIDKPAMEKYISEGYKIYFLPEQDIYNDQFSQMNYTDSIAKPYM